MGLSWPGEWERLCLKEKAGRNSPIVSSPVVILGKRRPALLAAAALNLPVVLVHDTTVGQKTRQLVREVIPANLDAKPPEWESVALELERLGPIRAIIAASERTVRAAAWLRNRLAVPGANEIQAMLGTDKLAMKSALRVAGIPVADFFPAQGETPMSAVRAQIGLPLVLKYRRGFGGRQTQIVFRDEDLPPSLPAGWMAERLLSGIEMSVESFVQDGQLRFVHLTEYFIPRFVSVSPNLLDRDTERALLALNRNVIDTLGIKNGLTHLECFVTSQGPVFGEIALRPPGGHLMNLIARAYAFDPWQAWLRLELGEPVSLPAAPICHAAVFLLHPGGAGRLTGITGWDEASTAEGIVEASLHVRPGDLVGERQGSGQESGYLLATGGSRLAALEAVLEARRRLRLELAPQSADALAGSAV